MATETTKVGLRKPAGTDAVNYQTDLNNNYDIVDRNIGLLAYTYYKAGSNGSYTRNSGTFADVDATNLSLVFTAPKSGKVCIKLNAMGRAGADGDTMLWNLREGLSDVANTDQEVTQDADEMRLQYAVIITGLTPGTAYTYKWGFARTGSECTILNGPQRQMLMEAFAA